MKKSIKWKWTKYSRMFWKIWRSSGKSPSSRKKCWKLLLIFCQISNWWRFRTRSKWL